MARTPQQVISSLQASIALVNQEIDTIAGPIPDVYINPQANEISAVEVQVQDLGLRFSVDYVANLDDNSVALFGANYGIQKDNGTVATGNVVFFTPTAPDPSVTISIPAGTLVSTDDGSLVFVTTEDVSIIGSNATVYFVASRRRYEVNSRIQALGTGPEYELPPNHINRMLSPIQGIQNVAQLSRTIGGNVASTNQQFMDVVRSRLQGSALGSLAGLDTLIRTFGQGIITDVSIVFSTDYLNFRRLTRRAAADIWIIGETDANQTDVFTSSGPSTTDFVLLFQPATAVISVSANNVNVPFEFIIDTNDQTYNSPNAQTLVRLATPVPDGTVVSVQYTYNSTVIDSQNYIDARSTISQPASSAFPRQPRLYELNALVRSAKPITIVVVATIILLSSFDPTTAQDAAINAVLDTINTGLFTSQLLPEDTRQAIANSAVGASVVTLQQFNRPDVPSLPVDTIEFAPNEYPFIDTTTININIRTA